MTVGRGILQHLCTVGLRPTMARIGVVHVIEAVKNFGLGFCEGCDGGSARCISRCAGRIRFGS